MRHLLRLAALEVRVPNEASLIEALATTEEVLYRIGEEKGGAGAGGYFGS